MRGFWRGGWAVAGWLLLAVPLTALAGAEAPLGRVVVLEGQAWLLARGGSWTQIEAGALPLAVPSGSLLRTGRGSLTLELPKDGGKVRLQPASELALRGPAPPLSSRGMLHLERGSLVANLGADPPVLGSPTGLARAPGSEVTWMTDALDGRAEIRVRSGRAWLEMAEASLELRAGQAGEAPPRQPPRLLPGLAVGAMTGGQATDEPPPAPGQAPAPGQPTGQAPAAPWRVTASQQGFNLVLKVANGARPAVRVLEGPVVEISETGLSAAGLPLGRRGGLGSTLRDLEALVEAGGGLRLRLELAPGRYLLMQHLNLAGAEYALDLLPNPEVKP